MKKETEEYHVIVNSKNNGSFYVGLFSIGGGMSEFTFSKKPLRSYCSLNQSLNAKELLLSTLNDCGSFIDKDEFFVLDNLSYGEVGEVSEVKIAKHEIITTVNITYI